MCQQRQRLEEYFYKSSHVKYWLPPIEDRMRQGKIFPYRFQKEHDHVNTLILASITVREQFSVLKYLVCGLLLQKP